MLILPGPPTAAQAQLDAKIRQLQRKDAVSASQCLDSRCSEDCHGTSADFFSFSLAPPVLALISVQGQITRAQQVIRVHIRESRANYAGEAVFYRPPLCPTAVSSPPRCPFPVFQRQWSQKIELLKKKIVELSRDMNNTEISKCAAHLPEGGRHRPNGFSPFSPPAMEILKLQSEVDKAKAMMAKEKEISESTTTRERRKRQRWLPAVENP